MTRWRRGSFKEHQKMAKSAFPRPKHCFIEDDARIHKRLDQYPEPWSVSVSAVAKGLLIADTL